MVRFLVTLLVIYAIASITRRVLGVWVRRFLLNNAAGGVYTQPATPAKPRNPRFERGTVDGELVQKR